jgi:hypothetical protein
MLAHRTETAELAFSCCSAAWVWPHPAQRPAEKSPRTR